MDRYYGGDEIGEEETFIGRAKLELRPGDDLTRLGRKMLSEEHGTTPDLVAAQLVDLFGALGLTRAIPGDQGLNTPWL